MDRRRFLKSLAALGASIPAAALAGRSSRATLDDAIAGLAGTPWWVPVLRCWKDGIASPALDTLCDALGVPEETVCDRIDIAVARLLLGCIEETLPSWGMLTEDGFVSARRVFPKHPDGTPVFSPERVGTLNWADSGPGFAWPEAYHVTTVRELGIHVVTASRDSEEAEGCTDHALGWGPVDVPARDVARRLLQTDWQQKADEYDQEAWACVLEAGLLAEADLESMRDSVWPVHDTEDTDHDATDDSRFAAGSYDDPEAGDG